MLVVYEVEGDVIVVEEEEDENFREKIIHKVYADYVRKVYNSPVIIKPNMEIKEF